MQAISLRIVFGRSSCLNNPVLCSMRQISTINSTFKSSKRSFSSPSSSSSSSTPAATATVTPTQSSSNSESSSSLGVLGTLFFGSLCLGTFTLGVWQSQRYFEKRILVQQRNHDLLLPPLSSYEEYVLQTSTLPSEQQQNQHGMPKQSFRRISLKGQYHHDYEILVGPRGPPPGSTQSDGGGGMSSSPQGYYIITPFEVIPSINGSATANDEKSSASTNKSDKNSEIHSQSTFVLINRGWVPRNMVKSSHAHPSQRNAGRSQSIELMNWDRPIGVIEETVVSTQPEAPRFLIPQHDFSSRPATLYWYDLPTMLEIAHPNYQDEEDLRNNSRQQQPQEVVNMLQYATKVVPSVGISSSTPPVKWPISPTAEKVGDFKVSPTIHIGYAVTWYGLSMAGLYMTRLLLLRR